MSGPSIFFVLLVVAAAAGIGYAVYSDAHNYTARRRELEIKLAQSRLEAAHIQERIEQFRELEEQKKTGANSI